MVKRYKYLVVNIFMILFMFFNTSKTFSFFLFNRLKNSLYLFNQYSNYQKEANLMNNK